MVEGEQKVCLAEPTLELVEETPLQVQMQLMEAMEGGEALAAEVALVEEAAKSVMCIPLILNKQEMEVLVELEVMEAAEEWEEGGGVSLRKTIIQEREVQEVLAVLEEEAEAAEVLGTLAEEIMVVMVQQEVMVEVEGVAAQKVLWALVALTALAALAALD